MGVDLFVLTIGTGPPSSCFQFSFSEKQCTCIDFVWQQCSEFKADNISVMVLFWNICLANKVLIISQVMDENSMSRKAPKFSPFSPSANCTMQPQPPHTTSLHSSWEDCFESAPQGHPSPFHSVPWERSATESVVRRVAWFKVKTPAITRWISLTESI